MTSRFKRFLGEKTATEITGAALRLKRKRLQAEADAASAPQRELDRLKSEELERRKNEADRELRDKKTLELWLALSQFVTNIGAKIEATALNGGTCIEQYLLDGSQLSTDWDVGIMEDRAYDSVNGWWHKFNCETPSRAEWETKFQLLFSDSLVQRLNSIPEFREFLDFCSQQGYGLTFRFDQNTSDRDYYGRTHGYIIVKIMF